MVQFGRVAAHPATSPVGGLHRKEGKLASCCFSSYSPFLLGRERDWKERIGAVILMKCKGTGQVGVGTLVAASSVPKGRGVKMLSGVGARAPV